ncbi:MAG TPA: 23S ribosomal RNA methyltransferase Erm [Dehalococcoidia bacterium]|nr:23S ribosomal RNA methyltransferase Erm [Dehalococcoidia bacterium]
MSTSTAERHSVTYAQNFLRSRNLVDRLLDRSSIGPDDLVLEIGPGKGIITERLARRCRRVVAVEKDAALARRLHRRFAGVPNVAVHAADALTFPLPNGRYKVFASIPFNATAAIAGKLTTGSSPPADAYLVVQREAAARFLGAPRETLASLLLTPWFAPSIVHHFRRSDFAPAPAVDVVLLRLARRESPLVAPEEGHDFRDFAVYAFTAWQPTLRATLDRLFPHRRLRQIMAELGIAPHATPAAVRCEQWLALFAAFRTDAGPRGRALIRGAEQRWRKQQACVQKIHRTRIAPSWRTQSS